MTQELFNRVAGVIADVLTIKPASITPATTADDVESWDSLNHLRLITAVEQHFGIRLSMAEIMALENVGDLADLVQAKSEQR